MRYGVVIALIGFAIVSGSLAADEIDPLAAKKEAWQKVLEREKFRFSESNVGMEYSLSLYNGACKIHKESDPKTWPLVTLKFQRDGKDALVLNGWNWSAFRAVDNVLYFAEFPIATYGCRVSAYDLKTGKKLWETKLRAAGIVGVHFAYLNQVTMELSSLQGLDKEGDGAITITGHESFGDYVEILDRRTGKLLAHKVYRQGFGPAK